MNDDRIYITLFGSYAPAENIANAAEPTETAETPEEVSAETPEEPTDDVLVLDSSSNKAVKTARKAAVRHPKTENNDKADNDLGIVQPDLGF